MRLGKYDLVIGSFINTKWRESKIDFTTPILIDANAILHEYNTTLLDDISGSRQNKQTYILPFGVRYASLEHFYTW